MQTSCSKCHTQIRPTDYFCFNCGQNLKPQPLSLSLASQISLYAISLFLPPFGLFRGLKYLRQPDQKSKNVGIIAACLTIISLVITLLITINIINIVNQQVSSSVDNMMGF